MVYSKSHACILSNLFRSRCLVSTRSALSTHERRDQTTYSPLKGLILQLNIYVLSTCSQRDTTPLTSYRQWSLSSQRLINGVLLNIVFIMIISLQLPLVPDHFDTNSCMWAKKVLVLIPAFLHCFNCLVT